MTPTPAHNRKPKSLARRLWRVVGSLFAAVVISLAIVVGVFRLVLPMAPEYHEQIEQLASGALGLPVLLEGLDARWRFGGPELVFDEARVLTADGKRVFLQADGGQVGIGVLQFLQQRRLVPNRLTLSGLTLSVRRTADDRWLLSGQELNVKAPAADRPRAWPQGRVELRDTRLVITDETRAGASWVFDEVELDVEADGDRVRTIGTIALPESMAGSLEFSAEVDRETAAGQQTLAWQLHVQIRDRSLAALAQVLTPAAEIVTGAPGDAELWFGGRDRNVQEASIRLDIGATRLAAASEMPPVEFARLSGRLAWEQDAQGWSVSGRQLVFDRDGRTWPEASFQAESVLGGGGRNVYVGASFLRIEDLAPWLRFVSADSPELERLRALSPAGDVRELVLRLHERADTTSRYELLADFEGVGWNPIDKLPGVRGLAGSLRAQTGDGEVYLKRTETELHMPGWFGGPLALGELRGQFSWARSVAGWRIAGTTLNLNSADFRVGGAFTLDTDTAQPDANRLDLRLEVRDLNLARAKGYLPRGIMRAKSLAWIDDALHGGAPANGVVEFKGPLAAFPFDNGEGRFHASLNLRDATMHYARGWPLATGVDADIEFSNAGLFGDLLQGDIDGLALTFGRVEIADLRQGILTYRSAVDGELDAVLDFLRKAPPLEPRRDVLQNLNISGQASLDVDVELPLKAVQDAKITVGADIDATAMSYTGFPQDLQSVRGKISYSDKALRGENLTALLLGRPISFNFRPEWDTDPETGARRVRTTVVSLEGRTDLLALDKKYELDSEHWGSGTLNWQGVVRAPGFGVELPWSASLKTDLIGVELTLPEPFGKKSDAAAPIEAKIDFVADGRAEGFLSSGDDRMAFAFVRGEPRWRLERAAIVLGEPAESVALPQEPGLEVRGTVPRLDVDRWLLVAGDEEGDGLLRHAEIGADELVLLGLELRAAKLQVDRNPREWLVQIESDRAGGALFVPLRGVDAPLIANFDHLHIGSASEEPAAADGEPVEGEVHFPDPRGLPPIELEVQALQIGAMRFGQVTLETQPTSLGLAVAKLDVKGDGFTATGSGEWMRSDPDEVCSFQFALRSGDLKTTLVALDFSAALESKDAQVDLDLNWPGTPADIYNERLGGIVKLRVGSGQLREVEPGAGRVFGLMSVAALPRRLTLDFRDVFDQGLGFDSIEGDFQIRDGDAYTDNLALRGPAVQVGVVGRAGLIVQDYDQTAAVYANVGSTLPVAGTIAGGPAVGAALLLLSEIFKDPLKEMSRVDYRILGSWDDPKISRLLPNSPQADAQ